MIEVNETLSNGRSTELINRTFWPAADEGLHGRNVLFINSVLRPLLKVSLTSIYST